MIVVRRCMVEGDCVCYTDYACHGLGSFAAWWQRLYGGYVPKGSLWSFLQQMGMTWN